MKWRSNRETSINFIFIVYSNIIRERTTLYCKYRMCEMVTRIICSCAVNFSIVCVLLICTNKLMNIYFLAKRSIDVAWNWSESVHAQNPIMDENRQTIVDECLDQPTMSMGQLNSVQQFVRGAFDLHQPLRRLFVVVIFLIVSFFFFLIKFYKR